MTRRTDPHTAMELQSLLKERLGLQVDARAWRDSEAKLQRLCNRMGWGTWPEAATWLVSHFDSPAVFPAVCDALLTCETYFLRERPGLDRAVEHLVAKVEGRTGAFPLARVWCAACSSGEEPYSLAALLEERLPDLPLGAIEIVATDFSPAALAKADRGIYTEWSFRAAPAHFVSRYFRPYGAKHFELGRTPGHPGERLRRRVTFMQLNLVTLYPPIALEPWNFDVVLCRNALMYFDTEMAEYCVRGMQTVLARNGLLIFGASEHYPISGQPSSFTAPETREVVPWSEPDTEIAEVLPPLQTHVEAAPVQPAEPPIPGPDYAAEEYRRGCALRETGDTEEAVKHFRRVLYLKPEHIAAHVALCNVYIQLGQKRLAEKHLATADRLLEALPSDEIIEELEGMTAGRVHQIISGARRGAA
jgi:chemotaxis protein methyltransferase CheR